MNHATVPTDFSQATSLVDITSTLTTQTFTVASTNRIGTGKLNGVLLCTCNWYLVVLS